MTPKLIFGQKRGSWPRDACQIRIGSDYTWLHQRHIASPEYVLCGTPRSQAMCQPLSAVQSNRCLHMRTKCWMHIPDLASSLDLGAHNHVTNSRRQREKGTDVQWL